MRMCDATIPVLAGLCGAAVACQAGPIGDTSGGGETTVDGGVAGGPDAWGGGGGWADATTADARWGGGDEFADASVCAAESVSAEHITLPVDILWVVDTSGSMGFETSTVESNLNAFAAQIDSWNLDYHVIVVGERGSGTNEVCIPEPLGGAGCADGPLLRHVNQKVGSHDALMQTMGSYFRYQDFLRAQSLKHIVVVTDDESNWPWDAAWFRSEIAQKAAPGFPPVAGAPEGYVFHSIVAWGDVPDRGCQTGSGIGNSYLSLTDLTGGVRAKVCETDWSPIFQALQDAVVEGSTLPCTFAVPEPPAGETLDPDKLNVDFTPAGGAATTIPRVDTAADCGTGQGWYYDDPANPTAIIACPATCDMFATASGQVDIKSGCATVVVD